MSSLYHGSFSIIEQNLQNFILKTTGRSEYGWPRYRQLTSFCGVEKWASEYTGSTCNARYTFARFVSKCLLAITSRLEKAEETRVAIKVRGRGWAADSVKWQMTDDKGRRSVLADSRIASIKIRPRTSLFTVIFILLSVSRQRVFLSHFLTFLLHFLSYSLL